MDPANNYKICPRCGRKDHLLARNCDGCGRDYQTQPDVVDSTLMLTRMLERKPTPPDTPVGDRRPRLLPIMALILLLVLDGFLVAWLIRAKW